MTPHTTTRPTATPIIARPGDCFEVGGHRCTSWSWKISAYECEHGFVMWKSQLHEAYRPASRQGTSR